MKSEDASLHIFDEHLSITHEVDIETRECESHSSHFSRHILKIFNNRVVLFLKPCNDSRKVLIYDKKGVFKMECKHAQSDVRIMAISGKSEIILGRQNSIYVYSMEDSLISTADLKTLIFDVAFHFGIDKLLISDELISGSVVIYDHDSKEEKKHWLLKLNVMLLSKAIQNDLLYCTFERAL